MTKVNGGQNFYSHADKTLPKNADSCFGDFPKDARVKKQAFVADPTALDK